MVHLVYFSISIPVLNNGNLQIFLQYQVLSIFWEFLHFLLVCPAHRRLHPHRSQNTLSHQQQKELHRRTRALVFWLKIQLAAIPEFVWNLLMDLYWVGCMNTPDIDHFHENGPLPSIPPLRRKKWIISIFINFYQLQKMKKCYILLAYYIYSHWLKIDI